MDSLSPKGQLNPRTRSIRAPIASTFSCRRVAVNESLFFLFLIFLPKGGGGGGGSNRSRHKKNVKGEHHKMLISSLLDSFSLASVDRLICLSCRLGRLYPCGYIDCTLSALCVHTRHEGYTQYRIVSIFICLFTTVAWWAYSYRWPTSPPLGLFSRTISAFYFFYCL